ncbi:GH25 family lysozyme, partial [Bifidobacterium breve]|uniref:GH25 family lysozyme n=1 Tax=Bifidobacterium breve TaxID=1685 RepID=UPI000A492099
MGKIKNRSKPLHALIAALFAVLLACTPAIAMADTVGIDVSGWQASNVTCTASYDFAVVKVSQGVGFENSSWRTQAKCVTDRGKSLGLYHYAGGNNAEAEADYFVGRARDYIGRAVLVLDWESHQNAQWGNSDWVRRFVQRVHTLTGVWPMVYVQASALGQIPGDVRANCGLWVAQYASNAPTGYQSRPWNYAVYGEAMRQYTSNGWISGYNGPLDLN